MVLVFFLFAVFALLGASSALGFVSALYVTRPRALQDLFDLVGDQSPLVVQIAVGLVFAVALPLVAGLAYAASGATWMTFVFGTQGHWFWACAAGAFCVGIVLGAMVRPTQCIDAKCDAAPTKNNWENVR